MGRLGLVLSSVVTLFLIVGITGCGGSSSKPSTPIPTSIRLTPSTASMDIGSILQFTADVTGAANKPITVAAAFQSSNAAILTFATGGVACAGSWDAAGQVCTPGGAGVAQVTASFNGVTSAPVTVYVHQHIDKIMVSPLPAAAGTPPPFPSSANSPATQCFTAAVSSTNTASSITYQASALSGTMDITSTVGPFSWQAANSQVATVTPSSVNGVLNGQAVVTAKTPGTTQVFASIANTSSVPFTFTTCPVQFISLAVASTGATSINAAKGTSATVSPFVVDISNNAITAPLTWSSSNPAVAAVSAAGAVTSSNAGGTTITASCVAPTCNIGLQPLQPVYATKPIPATYTGATTTPFTVYVSTTGLVSGGPTCTATVNCTFELSSISGTPLALASSVALSGPPTSLDFNGSGTKLFLSSQKGLMQFDPAAGTTVSTSANITGKVLAISPGGNRVIISDTTSSFNQVFILNVTTTGSSLVILPIAGATAAGFSPDNLKAYIASTAVCPGTSGQPACLFVYSPQAALQAIPLGAPASDIAFLGGGSYGYLAQGSSVSFLPSCDDPNSPLASQIASSAIPSATGTSIHALPDGLSFLTLNPPDVQLITAGIGGAPNFQAVPPQVIGCPAPYQMTSPFPAQGYLTNTSTAGPLVNLGQGNFTPVAFLISTDGTKAYLVMRNIGSVLVVDIPSMTQSFLSLSGNRAPLAASLAPDDQTLYVSTDDGNVHVINLVAGGDLTQVPVPSTNLCSVPSGPAPACLPDLLAVRP